VKKRESRHVTRLNSDASASSPCYQRTLTTMVGRHTIPEADITITHHLPPQDDDSTQDFSMSFAIPPQTDASNLLDQNYDDFFSGPGFVTLSTPVPPRLNAREKATRTPTAAPRPVLGPRTCSRTDLELPNGRTPPDSSPTLTSIGPPTTAGATGPGSRESDLDERIYNGLKPNTALSIVTTIQSMPTSAASCHSTNTQDAQISRQPPIPGPPKKNKEGGQTRGSAGVKPMQATSKPRSGDVPVCKTRAGSVSCVRLCQPSWGTRITGWDRMARLCMMCGD
jgi:hypothetical protein